ncbi:GDSL-type esterase/lipase family protein [Dyadobacter subterraneus]|uniref:GDSL family lipase n=1 Tax=Dyadobacter subterraneus TaxID=2773304 RepID=A0ABR9WC09_9BACT|nr:GDSL-type esterase/lipase family protein [Dyadobacter subterraneus]MBE9463017.1 GDSL family lipase [Dyadobacter subterraneus]
MYWYEEEVQRVEKELSRLSYQPETIFYGSSSITLWETLYSDFADLKPVNFGFGGSTLAACVWFFDRILGQLNTANRIIIYAGDNDLGDGRHPEEALLSYRQLIGQIRNKFGNVPCYYISIKPSIQRWEIVGQIIETNRLVKLETENDDFQHYIDIFPFMLTDQKLPDSSLFEPDGLHLSTKGYALWQEKIRENLAL